MDMFSNRIEKILRNLSEIVISKNGLNDSQNCLTIKKRTNPKDGKIFYEKLRDISENHNLESLKNFEGNKIYELMKEYKVALKSFFTLDSNIWNLSNTLLQLEKQQNDLKTLIKKIGNQLFTMDNNQLYDNNIMDDTILNDMRDAVNDYNASISDLKECKIDIENTKSKLEELKNLKNIKEEQFKPKLKELENQKNEELQRIEKEIEKDQELKNNKQDQKLQNN